MLWELLAPAQHHDKLFLGRVSAVRLIVPEAATCKDAVFHLLLLRQFFYFCSCQSSSFFPMKIALKGGERFLTKTQVVRSLGQARLFQSFSIAVVVATTTTQAGSALPDREQDAELLRAVIPEVLRETRCMWFDLGMH